MLRLAIIMLDPLSPILTKGEMIPRYYNPGDVFDEVHFVLLNDDRPSPEALATAVGRARVHVHNVVPPPRMMLRSVGWRPSLLAPFADRVAAVVESIRPSMLRALNPWLDGFVAGRISKRIGTPFVLSLHGNMDKDFRAMPRSEGGIRGRLHVRLAPAMERAAISSASAVICVYRFIEPYARKFGARRVETIYNVVQSDHIAAKTDYSLSRPPRMLILGRQLTQKNPVNALAAMRSIPDLTCDLVGRGPIHDMLKARAAEWGVASRCRFQTEAGNDELCRRMAEYDLLVSANDYGGVSKVELEAAFAGLPIVTNAHPDEDEPEVLGKHCLVTDGSVASWHEALQRLLSDGVLRERLGRGVREAVQPLRREITEAQQAALYRSLMVPVAVGASVPTA